MRTGLLLTQTNVNNITHVTGNCTIISVPVTTGTGVAANFFSRPLKTLKAVMQYFVAAFFVGKKAKRLALALCLMLVVSFIQAQTLISDQADYPPGSTVTLTGTGFQAGETVKVQVVHDSIAGDNDTSAAHQPWTITADANGNFTTTWLVPPDEDELGA